MLKKLLTSCLTIAAAAALAMPAMAADMSGKVGGRAVADLISKSYTPAVGDGYSGMDMISQGRIDYTLTSTEGDWTMKGKVEFRSSTGTEAYSEPVVLQKFVSLENDAFSAALGTQWFGFVYLTPYMGLTDSHDRYCYGCINLRDDRLNIGIKQVGLNVVYGSNIKTVAVSGDFDGDGISDTVTFNNLGKTEIGLQYNGAFGPVTVAAQYLSETYSNVENLSSTSGTGSAGGSFAGAAKDTFMDGYVQSELAFAVRYGISEAMFAEFDYSSIGTTPKDGDTATNVAMGVAFAMAFSETQGIAVAYDMVTRNSGASGADDLNDTYMTFTFNQKIGGQQVWVGYDSESIAADKDNSNVTSVIALGGRVNF